KAKSYLRPVTSATSIPRRAASQMAARFASGSFQRLSSSVPSMSRAIRRTPISSILPAFNRRNRRASNTCCEKSPDFPVLDSAHKTAITTRRLYYDDAFHDNFTAQVVSCQPLSAVVAGQDTTCWGVLLDQTHLYPTPGGQPHALGKL